MNHPIEAWCAWSSAIEIAALPFAGESTRLDLFISPRLHTPVGIAAAGWIHLVSPNQTLRAILADDDAIAAYLSESILPGTGVSGSPILSAQCDIQRIESGIQARIHGDSLDLDLRLTQLADPVLTIENPTPHHPLFRNAVTRNAAHLLVQQNCDALRLALGTAAFSPSGLYAR